MLKFACNAKELDEESGMYYFEARYYAPPIFISPDPLFEKYPWMSMYAYCGNNPVSRIDPTGMTWYEVNENGYITPIMDKETGKVKGADDDFDMLCGRKGSDPIKIDDKSIMNSLYSDKKGDYTFLSAIGKRDEMTRVSDFLMDNTSVEWSAFGAYVDPDNKVEKNFIYTSHQNLEETYGATVSQRIGQTTNKDGTPANKLIYFTHNHPKWNLSTMKETPKIPTGDDYKHMRECQKGSPKAEFNLRREGITNPYPSK